MKYTNAVKLWQNGTLKKLSWTNYWVVMQEFCWYIDYVNKKEAVVVEKWFCTDLASIPRILWSVFNKSKFIAPILHDYLYKNKPVSRLDADLIFLEALSVEWANIFEKTCYYWGVRMWWWVSWHFNKY